MKRSLSTFAAVMIGAGLCSGAAQAQTNMPNINGGTITGPVVGGPQARAKKQAPPPALPGARTVTTDPAPMDRPPSEMRPTEALFDAINRGDIASARDALSRGAELNAHNVLGMTPIELSVDLGRNDITFLLLSMRGSGGGSAPPQTAARAVPPKAEAVRQQAPRAMPVRQAAAPAAKPAQAMTRQQYAVVPAAPAPGAGFLGFGGTTTH